MRNRPLLQSGLLILVAATCLAQSPAITGFTGAAQFGSINATDVTIGWTFTPTANLTVTAIGVWELDIGFPLNQTHQVGLWTAGGALLASGTVLTNSPVTGNWRYVAIPATVLTAGQTYVAGSAITAPFTDVYSRVPAAGGTVTTNPLITLGTSVASPPASGFAFPSTSDATFLARLGPNLMVSAGPASPSPSVSAAAPVSPWSLGLIAIGLAASGLLLIRKRLAA